MLKKQTKIILVILTILLVVSTMISFASETPVTTSLGEPTSTVPGDNARETTDNTTDDNTTDDNGNDDNENDGENAQIYDGNLYIFNDNITMDQLVDGNVFLFGNDIKVTGKVNGSLYVMGNNVTFEQDSYIVNSIFAIANHLTLNGSANDLYAMAATVDMAYDSFMIRDLTVTASTFNFNGGVGRNAFVYADTFNFSTSNQAAIVYGNLEYTAKNELSLSKDFVQGEVKYSKYVETTESTSERILEKVISFCNTLLVALVIFLLCSFLAPKFVKNSSEYISVKKAPLAFGIGTLASFVVILVSFGLLFSTIGIPLGFLLFGLYLFLIMIASPIASICITQKLKEALKLNKNYLTYITFILVILVLWAITLIPVVGFIVTLVINLFGFGTILHYIFTRNTEKKENKEIKDTNTNKNDETK